MKQMSRKFRWSFAGDVQISQCIDCKHKYVNQAACRAFPDGIPDDILRNEFIHTVIHPAQKNAITYDKIERD